MNVTTTYISVADVIGDRIDVPEELKISERLPPERLYFYRIPEEKAAGPSLIVNTTPAHKVTIDTHKPRSASCLSDPIPSLGNLLKDAFCTTEAADEHDMEKFWNEFHAIMEEDRNHAPKTIAYPKEGGRYTYIPEVIDATKKMKNSSDEALCKTEEDDNADMKPLNLSINNIKKDKSTEPGIDEKHELLRPSVIMKNDQCKNVLQEAGETFGKLSKFN